MIIAEERLSLHDRFDHPLAVLQVFEREHEVWVVARCPVKRDHDAVVSAGWY